MVLAAIAVGAALLFNYWAPSEWASLLVYTGIVTAILGLANVALPFRFMGVRKRLVGALVLAVGAALSAAALYWPAATLRAAQPKTLVDEIMPEYQFSEVHRTRVHAPREQVMRAIREATFNDMTSLTTLLKIRGVVLRAPSHAEEFQNRRILEAFQASGYLTGTSDHEIALFGAVDIRAQRRPDLRDLQQLAAYRAPGTVKMAFGFDVHDAGNGWCDVNAETRVAVIGEVATGMARYWRLILPGSGLLRRQWLEGIKHRAEAR